MSEKGSTVMDIEVTTEVITPEKATAYLNKNVKNRNVVQRAVTEYANEMKNGRWLFNGDPIRFDTDGILLDGQHRLLAAVQADESFEAVVIRGLPAETQQVMDTGRKRSFANTLALAGEKDPTSVAAVATIAYLWDSGARGVALRTHGNYGSYSLQIPVLMDYFMKNRDEIIGVMTDTRRLQHVLPTGIRAAGLAKIVLSRIDEDDAEFFIEHLISGAELAATDPIHVLRNKLFKEKTQVNSAHSIPSDYTLALIFKAWNAWRNGSEMQILKFKVGGLNKEKFPEPK